VLESSRWRSLRPDFAALLAGLLLVGFTGIPVRGLGTSAPALVPLRGDGTSWLVEAAIDGRAHVRFLLDTGASYCVVAPALVEGLGLAETGHFATVETANGPVRAPLVRLPSLELEGGVRVRDVEAIVHDAGPRLDGVLGLNLLNRWRYAVDPQRRRLELE
jgi:clan AA aspartic protease (TIGR02281 family)